MSLVPPSTWPANLANLACALAAGLTVESARLVDAGAVCARLQLARDYHLDVADAIALLEAEHRLDIALNRAPDLSRYVGAIQALGDPTFGVRAP